MTRSQTIYETSAAGGVSTANPTDFRMLDLPDGSVLFSDGGSQLYAYQPDGMALKAGQPTIISINTNFYRSYHLTGRLLNGISEGAGYGDDAQMNSNYPLVRMTNNATGNVYYARTYDWSSTGVTTGTNIVSTEFMLPANLPAGMLFFGGCRKWQQFRAGAVHLQSRPIEHYCADWYCQQWANWRAVCPRRAGIFFERRRHNPVKLDLG